MESVAPFMCVLASSSLWLTGSGLVLWLCLRSRLRLSPGTRAAASLLIALQGWMWIGIPVSLHIPAPLDRAWITPQPASIPRQQTAGIIPAQQAAGIEAAEAMAPLPLDGGLPFDSRLPFAASFMPSLMSIAGAAASAVWLAGIAILLWRSIGGFVALSRMVHALPHAPVEWQNELSALCGNQSIRPLVLKISNVASPMLVQTWGSACIVVPAWLWESCTAQQRTSILLHELAHFKRGDVWRQLGMRLLVLPHWFNPVAWWAARQFEAASEAACDEAACGSDPRVAISYAKTLLVLNETMWNERAGLRCAQALAISGASLSERIRRVLHPEFQKESPMSRFLILSAMVALASLATIRIRAADESPTAKTETAESEAAQAPGVILRRRTITEEYEKAEPAKAPAALLANGSFEEIQESSNDPQAWFATRIPQAAGHFVLASSSVAHSGKRSVVVEIGDSHPDTRVDYNWTAEAKGWKVGETYELSGWIKTENAKGPGFLMAQCWSEDGKRPVGYSQSPCEVRGTADWTRVSTLLRVPEGTASVRIRAGLTSQGNKGAKAWIDDLSLVKVSRSANEENKNKSAKNKAAGLPGGLLLANGGFEEIQENSNDPEAWFGTRIAKTAGHYLLASSSVAHGGKRSAVVEIGDSHPDRRVAYNWTAEAKGWKAGETYELSGWIKTENAKNTAFIMAQFWDGEGENPKMIGGATTQFSSPVKGTTDWTRASTRLTVPEGTKVVRIRAGLSSQGNPGAKAWLDDISLVAVAK
jgi:beta-lactamase regulating signal transducer with metallopeptidase domain